MAAEYVVKQFIGQSICVGAGVYVGINHHGPRKGPLGAIASYVQSSTTAQALCERPCKLRGKSFALPAWVFVPFVLYGFNSH
jgi:hypothetical protein